MFKLEFKNEHKEYFSLFSFTYIINFSFFFDGHKYFIIFYKNLIKSFWIEGSIVILNKAIIIPQILENIVKGTS